MSVRFRLASVDDAKAVLALKRAAIREIAGWYYGPEEIEAWTPGENALPVFEAAIESDRYTVLLAETDGDIAGYGVLNGREGRIDAAFVDPDHGGEGIASSLVGQLESHARMRDIEELDVVASLNAKPFYEKLGYWHFHTETRKIEGVDVDFALMHKRLTEVASD